jgi:serine protease Do
MTLPQSLRSHSTMKTLRYFTSVLGLAALCPAPRAADNESPPAKSEKKELRVLAGPEHGGRVQVHPFGWSTRIGDHKPEMESVTYLGVITSPVNPTLTAQLGLAAGAGLVVNHLEENSPAAAVLKEHDILLKLDDQLLVDARQLSVLIRQKKEGDEVALTYIRAGKQAVAKVKLGKHDAPKMAAIFSEPLEGGGGAFAFGQASGGGGGGTFELAVPGGPGGREDVDHVLSLIERHGGEPMRMWIDRSKGPGFRAMSVNTGNSNMVFSDDKGSLELTMKDEKKSLVAKNKQGDTLFSGPVNTPEERKALPNDVRERLEQLEGMQDVTFRTDGDFQGTETRALRPQPRGISLPQPETRRAPVPPAPARPPIFF